MVTFFNNNIPVQQLFLFIRDCQTYETFDWWITTFLIDAAMHFFSTMKRLSQQPTFGSITFLYFLRFYSQFVEKNLKFACYMYSEGLKFNKRVKQQ